MNNQNQKIVSKGFFLTICAALFLWIVINLAVVIVDKAASLVTFVVAVATVGAAVATWKAAKKAAESAEIARESMDASKQLGKQTLEETQRTNRRTAFENRYAMLLAQHDQYHRQLCDYLDTRPLTEKEYKEIGVSRSGQKDIYDFFDKNIHEPTPEACFSFLTGHEIISRYMRTLYHLLRFVSQDCVFEKEESLSTQKNYTSPVRSTIRNDVLLLIAVNALNVVDERAVESAYPLYQQLLHKYDFFEHAIFLFPFTPNELFKRDDWDEKIQRQILKKQSDYTSELHNQTGPDTRSFTVPSVEFSSPLIMVILIFKNPMRKAALDAMRSLPNTWQMSGDVVKYIQRALDATQTANDYLAKIHSCETRRLENEPWIPVKEEMLSVLQKEAFHPYCPYDNYLFRLYCHEQEIKGETVRRYFRDFTRSEKLRSELDIHNGQEGYLAHLRQRYEDSLSKFMNNLKAYDVSRTELTSEKKSAGVSSL